MLGHKMPMTDCPVELSLPKHVRTTLAGLLDAALDIPDGGDVLSHLPQEPWGDMDEFRELVDVPLQRGHPPSDEVPARPGVVIEANEVAFIKPVLDALGESYAGGVPWMALTADERRAVAALSARLKTEGP